MASKNQLDRKNFAALLSDVKQRIATSQTRAMLAVNSERNIKRMLAFHRDYPDTVVIVPQAVAQLPAAMGRNLEGVGHGA